jgi:dTDP-glucose 4,6-dehydratase
LRVAVLGSNSFAGSDFVDLLLESGQHDVLGISRSAERAPAFLAYGRRPRQRFVYKQLDINRDSAEVVAALDSFAPQFVVNYSAQGDDAASWAHPADFFQTNCVALAGLVDHLKDRTYLQRFLQISSSGVYGNAAGAIDEETRLAPESPYGVSKAAADLLLLAYFKNFAFPVQIVRPPNLYGPHQQLFRIIPKSIVMLKRGEPIELHGGGNAVRLYLHIRDASRAVLAILERGATGEVYNLAPDAACRIRDLVAVTCDLLALDFAAATREVEDRRGQSSGQDIDSGKIRRELGWKPQVPLRAGIEDVRDWIEREWESLTSETLGYVHQR